jgi:hypothetical protein
VDHDEVVPGPVQFVKRSPLLRECFFHTKPVIVLPSRFGKSFLPGALTQLDRAPAF